MTQHGYRVKEDLHTGTPRVRSDNLEMQLDQGVVTTDRHATLREWLERARLNFEIDHPVTMNAIRKAVDVLVEAGF